LRSFNIAVGGRIPRTATPRGIDLRCPIGAAGHDLLPAACSSTTLKLTGSRGGRDRWPTVVYGSKLRAVLAGEVLVLLLQARGGDVPVALGRHFSGRRPGAQAAWAAIVADSRNSYIINHIPVIYISDVHTVNVVHCPVIKEPPAPPVAPGIPNPGVTIAVIDSTVETDMGTPVSSVP